MPSANIVKVNETPRYIYKVLSIEDWAASQCLQAIQLSSTDNDFIHFSTEEQLERIISKYWNNVPEFVVLKIDTTKLPGNMIFEANPGGANRYYHLYNGSIPLEAVVESRTHK